MSGEEGIRRRDEGESYITRDGRAKVNQTLPRVA